MRRAARFLASVAAALLPISAGGAPALSAPAPAPSAAQAVQRDQAALPAPRVTTARLSRKIGPLGLPTYTRTGLPPWIDRHGRLLRQVVR